MLGVIFGVATVIVVVSLVEGFNHYVDGKIADIGTLSVGLGVGFRLWPAWKAARLNPIEALQFE